MQEKYDFGLSAEQEEHAKNLHFNNIVIDLLFQGPIGTYSFPIGFEEKLEGLAAEKHPGNRRAQLEFMRNHIRTLFIDGELSDLYEECWYESGISAGNRQLSLSSRESALLSALRVQEEFDKKPWLTKALRAEDIENAHKENLKAGIISCQETLGLGKDLGLLETLYNFGLRVVQLTYNNQELVGAGCMEENNAGLSSFGIKFVEKLNELGIIVDTAHCGKQTTLDSCRYSKKPVVATHTGAEKVFFHSRAKSDEEIVALAKTGGVIGVFAMPWFIADDPGNSTLEHFFDHIDHIVKLTGIDHVGIGTDWPMPQTLGMAVDFKKLVAVSMGFKEGDGPSTEYIKGLKDYRSFPNITRGLLSRGYGDDDIIKIIGGNWLRVFREICG
ncbi:MAG: dipeptidase [Treponema sp.]|nr:dipeptidase [Treponema sp.]